MYPDTRITNIGTSRRFTNISGNLHRRLKPQRNFLFRKSEIWYMQGSGLTWYLYGMRCYLTFLTFTNTSGIITCNLYWMHLAQK